VDVKVCGLLLAPEDFAQRSGRRHVEHLEGDATVVLADRVPAVVADGGGGPPVQRAARAAARRAVSLVAGYKRADSVAEQV
jgi:hypothetical protein